MIIFYYPKKLKNFETSTKIKQGIDEGFAYIVQVFLENDIKKPNNISI